MSTIQKQSIKIKGKSVPIDLYFLDALSLKHFGKFYREVKPKTNALVRALVKDEDNLHPQNIERYIISDFFAKKLKGKLSEVDIYQPLCYTIGNNYKL